MTDKIKTKEDLQNDAVRFVYGFFKFAKYAIIVGILSVCWFFYHMSASGDQLREQLRVMEETPRQSHKQ